MKNRIYYQCNDKAIYQDVVNAMRNTYRKAPNTRKPLLGSLASSVEDRYDEYEQSFLANNLLSINDCTRNELESDALIYLYEGNSQIVDNLKISIKDNQEEHLKQICPSCGLLPAITVDHYIPKEIYPDFSIYSKNLIWTCGTCNGKKSTYWKESTHRGIINFYTDHIPTFRFIDCTIVNHNGILKVDYHLNVQLLSTYPHIVKHFERLDILGLYKEHIPTKLSEIIADIQSFKGILDSKKVKQILYKRYFSRIKDFGVNDWKSLLLRNIIIGKHYEQYL
ncbi:MULTISPECIES: hypothetical protein [Vibrio]|uniref:HNH endonuclease n=1 Tax=Vibrio cortegadensis TaxID=1328770 RepID=A0ABV4MBV0_9VIBR|nr:hypothetical protein [Vibrio parahaemolyticus]EIE9609461.1 hypothetical protein [Vibrio parahaemolyticus]MDW9223820.1 hypothetical protein [Vibrio parahaemolyticus]TOK52084.1 hypothetical protein CGI15_24640 [Vibrio parahaemolyticus]TOR03561.1 hypothetical protein CGG81_23490 [Vibrio parahaemolyticus]